MDIDVIGKLYDPPLFEGGEPVELPHWHVNTTRRDMLFRPDLEPYRYEPATLRRVWAGDDPAEPLITVALRFASEAEALSLLS